MATIWSPAPYVTKQEWLLADGSIVTSPDFETTSSGRRVRIAGTTESFGNKQVEALISRAIDQIAQDRGTTKVIRLFPDSESDAYAAAAASVPSAVFTDAVNLHMLGETSRAQGSTTAFWKFQVPDAPVYAYVFITLRQYNERYSVQPYLVFRSNYPNAAGLLSYFTWNGSTNANSDQYYRYSDEAQAISRWLTENPPFDGVPVLDFQEQTYPGQLRTAVVKFAELCKRFDNLDTIQIPDMRDGAANLVTLTPKRVLTNYSASFHNELLSFVQTGPIMDRIKENYKALMEDFRILGLQTSAQADDTAIAKALNGDKTAIKCQMVPVEDTDVSNGIDSFHSVVFDFASGSMVVNCSHATNLDETAEAWEIAKFKAEMTGEVDVLMEYAKAYQNPKEQKRLLKIINQRTVPDVD